MSKSKKLYMSKKQKFLMISRYAREKTGAQVKAVFFVVAYLFLFQIVVLKIPVADSFMISTGIGLVIAGLALFLEGLLLGIMPLGELCGLKLPQKTGMFFLLFFAFLLGIVATLAEPAVAILQTAGSGLNAWETPLLYSMLNTYPLYLVLSIAGGVGLAVLIGVLRFLKNWHLRPLITVIIPVLLALSIYAYFDENLLHITALAWDCGGITTGPVTVPLIIALGIGITRATGSSDKGISGLGVVTLASAIPVAAVLAAGIIIGTGMPSPMSKAEFFHSSNMEKVSQVFTDSGSYLEYAVNNQDINSAVINQFDGDFEAYHAYIAGKNNQTGKTEKLLPGILSALKAVLPLSLLLILLTFILREKIPLIDEKLLGIAFAVAGFFLFSIGMETGLSRLGVQAGSNLPITFTSIAYPEKTVIIRDFDFSQLQSAYTEEGTLEYYFSMKHNSSFIEVVFDHNQYDSETGIYRHIPEKGPVLGSHRKAAGITLFLLFAFFLGLGATIAEPALNALGITLEEVSVGTFHRSFLIKTVAAGVGIGLVFGMLRILYNIPLIFLITPPYLLILVLNFFSSEEFINIAWDSAGVTTGPVTVPLVIAMGLGAGNQTGGGVESFGILALASVFPVLTVIISGIILNRKQNTPAELYDE